MIGVCVSAYNRERYLRECLDSLGAQDCPDFKVFVTTDGSTDYTDAIAQDYQKQGKIVWLGNTGKACVGTSKNRCVTAALGAGVDAVQMLDSDDKARPQLLSKMYEFLGFSDVDWVNCDGQGFGGRSFRLVSSPEKTVAQEAQTNYLTSWGMFKAETLKKENYRKGMTTLDDWELYIRLLKKGFRYGVLGEILVDYRVHDDQLTRTHAHLKDELYKQILNWNKINL